VTRQSDDDTAARLTARFVDKLPADIREAVVADIAKNPDKDVNLTDLAKAVSRGRQLNAAADAKKRRK
jgi:hypothetical protein